MGNKMSARVYKTGTFFTVGTLSGATASARRARLHEFALGCIETPADLMFLHAMMRASGIVAGTTGLAVTPTPDDNADPVLSAGNPVVLAGAATTSADPTGVTGVNVLTGATIPVVLLPVHQRNTNRWVAAPGSELMMPATSGTGFDLVVADNTGAASASDFAGHLRWEIL